MRPGLLNIGWLDDAHAFSMGSVEESIVEKLWHFCCFPVVNTRGFHVCELCQVRSRGLLKVTRGIKTLQLGSAEIRVFGAGVKAYAAPDMIYHYVNAHGYRPPPGFLKALQECPLPETASYHRLVMKGDCNGLARG